MKKTLVLTLLTGLAVGTTALAQGRHHGARFFERLDANSDGRVTRDELKADVQRRFVEFDADKNGKISAAELTSRGAEKLSERQDRMAEHLRSADRNNDGKWTKDELSRMPERMFAKLDTNGDAVLTRAELDAGRDGWSARHGDFLQHLLAKADTNGDGAIDTAEAQRLADGRFDAIDANHDGVVEQSEWKSGRHGFGGHCDGDKPQQGTQDPHSH